jgi:methyl-accepting chemotaxis protein
LALKEEATARQVNENGAFLKMSTYPEVGMRVTLANFLSAQTAEARVLAAPNTRSGVASGIVVELVVPSEVFWGIDLQVNKTVVELQNLENALKAQDVDLRLVREYRSAIDNICSLMDTLRQHRVSMSAASDDQDALRDLAEDRVRRSNQLCADVIADIDAGRIPDNAASVQELNETVQVLQQRMKKIGKLAGSSVNRSRAE